jgi:hypothetical protein
VVVVTAEAVAVDTQWRVEEASQVEAAAMQPEATRVAAAAITVAEVTRAVVVTMAVEGITEAGAITVVAAITAADTTMAARVFISDMAGLIILIHMLTGIRIVMGPARAGTTTPTETGFRRRAIRLITDIDTCATSPDGGGVERVE